MDAQSVSDLLSHFSLVFTIDRLSIMLFMFISMTGWMAFAALVFTMRVRPPSTAGGLPARSRRVIEANVISNRHSDPAHLRPPLQIGDEIRIVDPRGPLERVETTRTESFEAPRWNPDAVTAVTGKFVDRASLVSNSNTKQGQLVTSTDGITWTRSDPMPKPPWNRED